ncbi:hypothetical protein [Bradyrhizobium sp. DOA1]|uniref:hypothetical protein n=1 Tax=Bradyrhizobium sp. DOA1 TaxID=1126616 RepID=UPI00077C1CF7|nr:hypothetical protein [Bradyrhizobium sp. DOA1]KYH00126.1 hypothetical protein SE91_17900 [Bradyrhizobium sp. DOA1]
MNQRYDLFAVSLLLFIALLAGALTLAPISLEGISRWQTLIGGAIGGTITGLGLLVATMNVTRQLRLTARGKEQDRLEKELPGLRAAAHLLARISNALEKEASGTKVLTELGERGFDKDKPGDFILQVVDALPTTPDATKRELAIELFKLRASASRVIQKEWAFNASRNHLTRTPAMHQDRTDAEAALTTLHDEMEDAQERFKEALTEFEAYRERLIALGKSEAQKYQILRREQEKHLALPH